MRINYASMLGASLYLMSASTFLSASSFRVMSYNVENFWDGNSDNTTKEWEDFMSRRSPEERKAIGNRFIQYYDYSEKLSNWYTPEVLEKKIQHFLKVLSLVDYPEIVALQEIESAGNTSEIFAVKGQGASLEQRLRSLGYKTFLIGEQDTDNPTSVTTAFIAKMPLKALPRVDITDDNYSTSARDLQAVQLTQGKHRLVLFNNHWKSKSGGEAASEPARRAMAEALKKRITEERETPNTSVIVLGDLNAHYHEEPLAVLGITGQEKHMTASKTDELYDLWFENKAEDRWEHSYMGDRSVLSHMIISDDLYYNTGFQYVDNSFRVVGQSGKEADLMLDADGAPFRWQIRKDKPAAFHIGEGYSDHLPLIATFNYTAPSTRSLKKITLRKPSQVDTQESPAANFNDVRVCDEKEAVAIKAVSFAKSEQWLNRCVIIEGQHPLKSSSAHFANFIDVKTQGRSSAMVPLLLVMNRSWDGRPNVSDSRVDRDFAARQGRFQQARFGHPQSNKCFTRKVLQGTGGTLTHAMGRLGFYDGRPTVFIATREEQHIQLTNLPPEKANACPWDGDGRLD